MHPSVLGIRQRIGDRGKFDVFHPILSIAIYNERLIVT